MFLFSLFTFHYFELLEGNPLVNGLLLTKEKSLSEDKTHFHV